MSKNEITDLLNLLKDKDDWNRQMAAERLVTIYVNREKLDVPLELITALLDSLNDDDWRVQEFSEDAFSNIFNKREIPQELTSALLNKLVLDNQLVGRISSADVLGRIYTNHDIPKEVIKALINSSNDTDLKIREAVARSFGYMFLKQKVTREVIVVLKSLLNDDERIVQMTTTMAMGDLYLKREAPPIIIKELLGLLKHDYWELCGWAAEALGKIYTEKANETPKKVISALLRTSQTRFSLEKTFVASAFGNIYKSHEPPTQILAELINLLNDHETSDSRVCSAEALGKIFKNICIENIPTQVISELTNLLQDKNHQARAFSAIALGRIFSSNSTPEPIIHKLISLTREEVGLVRRYSASALGFIYCNKQNKISVNLVEELIPMLEELSKNLTEDTRRDCYVSDDIELPDKTITKLLNLIKDRE